MTGHVKVSGAFKTLVSGTAVKVGGAWKDVSFGYVKVSGAWKQFFQNIVYDLSHSDSASGLGTQTALLTFEPDGDVVDNEPSDIGDWISPKSEATASDYEMRYTNLVGTLSSATMAENVWHDMATAWSASLQTTQPGLIEASYTVEIRIGAGDVIDSGSCSLAANESSDA